MQNKFNTPMLDEHGQVIETTPSIFDGSLTAKKKRSLEQRTAAKQLKLGEPLQINLSDSPIEDGDTLGGAGSLFGGLRLGSTDQQGTSLDAFDFPHEFTDPTKQAGFNRKLTRQRAALDLARNLRPGTSTDADVFAQAQASKDEFRNLAFEGTVAPVAPDGFTGPTIPDPEIVVQQLGTGLFGRPLVQVTNPITGKVINDELNTPDFNANEASRFNAGFRTKQREKRNEAEKVKRNTIKHGEVVSRADLEGDNGLGTQVSAQVFNNLVGFASAGKTVDRAIDSFPKSLQKIALRANNDITDTDKELFESVRKKAKDSKGVVEDFQAALSKEESTFLANKQSNSPYKVLSKLQIIQKKIDKNRKEGKSLQKFVNTEAVEEQGADITKDIREGNYLKAVGRLSDVKASLQTAIGSLPQAAAIIATGGGNIPITASDRYEDYLSTYKKQHKGKDPSSAEEAKMVGIAAVTSLIEKFGTDLAFGVPSKFVKSLSPIQSAAFNKVSNLVGVPAETLVKRIAKDPKNIGFKVLGTGLKTVTGKTAGAIAGTTKVIGAQAGTVVGRLGAGLVGEGVEESVVELGDQVAKNIGTDKEVDLAKVATAGVQGIGAASVHTTATIALQANALRHRAKKDVKELGKKASFADAVGNNKGDYTVGSSDGVDVTEKSIGSIATAQRSSVDKTDAVGKYGFTGNTLTRAMKTLGIDPDTKLTPALQDRIFRDYVIKRRNKSISYFIQKETPTTRNLESAVKQGVRQWGTDIDAVAFEDTLIASRFIYDKARKQGMSKDEAFNASLQTFDDTAPAVAEAEGLGKKFAKNVKNKKIKIPENLANQANSGTEQDFSAVVNHEDVKSIGEGSDTKFEFGKSHPINLSKILNDSAYIKEQVSRNPDVYIKNLESVNSEFEKAFAAQSPWASEASAVEQYITNSTALVKLKETEANKSVLRTTSDKDNSTTTASNADQIVNIIRHGSSSKRSQQAVSNLVTEDTKDLLIKSKKYQKAVDAYISGGNTSNTVQERTEEVEGTTRLKANNSNVGLGGHINSIVADIRNGDKTNARKKLNKLKNYGRFTGKIISSLSSGIAKAEASRKPVTVTVGRNFTHVIDGSSKSSVLEAKDLVSNHYNKESEAIFAGYNMIKELARVEFGSEKTNSKEKTKNITTEETATKETPNNPNVFADVSIQDARTLYRKKLADLKNIQKTIADNGGKAKAFQKKLVEDLSFDIAIIKNTFSTQDNTTNDDTTSDFTRLSVEDARTLYRKKLTKLKSVKKTVADNNGKATASQKKQIADLSSDINSLTTTFKPKTKQKTEPVKQKETVESIPNYGYKTAKSLATAMAKFRSLVESSDTEVRDILRADLVKKNKSKNITTATRASIKLRLMDKVVNEEFSTEDNVVAEVVQENEQSTVVTKATATLQDIQKRNIVRKASKGKANTEADSSNPVESVAAELELLPEDKLTALSDINTLTELVGNKDLLSKHELEPTKENLAALEFMVGGAKTLADTAGSLFKAYDNPNNKSVFTKNLDLDVLRGLANKNTGKLPQHILNAIGMTSRNYIGSQLINTIGINSPESMNAIVGRSPESHIPTSMYVLLNDVGTLQNNIAPSLGKQILRNAGYTANKESNGYLQEKLELSLGNLAIASMAKNDHIDITSLNNNDLSEYRTTEQKTNSNKPVNFVKIATARDESLQPVFDEEGKSLLEPVTESIIDNAIVESEIITKLFKGKPRSTVLNEPSTQTPSRMKNTKSNVSKAIKDGVKFAQTVKWEPKQNMQVVTNKLGDNWIKDMLGFIDPKEIDLMPIDSQAQAKGQNQTILNDLTRHNAYMDTRGDDYSTPFYFKYNVMQNTRSMIDSTTINVQTSKLHRHLYGAKAWNVELTINNKDDMDKFDLALDEPLGIDSVNELFTKTGSIRKRLPSEKHTKFAEGIKVLLSDSDTYTDKQKAILLDAVNAGGEKTASLDALVAISEYAKAKQSKAKTFTTNLAREVDGTTNGVINTQLQLPTKIETLEDAEKLRDFLRAGGVIFKQDTVNNYNEWKATPGNKDNYKKLTTGIVKGLLDIKKSFVESDGTYTLTSKIEDGFGLVLRKSVMDNVAYFTDKMFTNDPDNLIDNLDDISNLLDITSDGRAFSKPILMTTVYMASVNSALDKLAVSTLHNMNAKAKEALDSKDSKLINAVSVRVATLLRNNEYSGRQGLKQFLDTATSNPELKVLTSHVSNVFSDPITNALTDLLGSTSHNTNMLNQKFKFMNMVFVNEFSTRIGAAQAEKNAPLSITEEDSIFKDLVKEGLVPGMAHYSSKGYEDALHVLNKVRQEVSTEDGGQTTQQYNQDVPVIHKTVSTDKGETVPNYELGTTRSRTANIKRDRYDTNIGVGGVAMSAISMDGNTNSRIMQFAQMLNVYDAVMTSVDTASATAEKTNKQHLKVNDGSQWSINKASQEAYERAKSKFDSYSGGQKQKLFADAFNGEKKTYIDGSQVKNAKQLNALIQTNFNDVQYSRKVLLTHKQDKIIGSDQYADNGGKATAFFDSDPTSALPTDDVKAVEKLVDETFASVKNIEDLIRKDSSKGSSRDADINYNEFVSDYDTTITLSNIGEVFDDMGGVGNVQEDPKHSQHLRSVIVDRIAPVVADMGVYLQQGTNYEKTFKESQGQVDILKDYTDVYIETADRIVKANAVSGMSAQEIMGHELSHVLLEYGLKSNAGVNKVLSELVSKVQSALDKSEAPYEMFLNKDNSGNVIFMHDKDAEIEAAKERYDYIFNRGDTYLHEFFAHGLTNKNFIEALKDIDNREPRETGLVPAFLGLLEKILQFISGEITDNKSGSISDALTELTRKISALEAKSKKKAYYAKYNAKVNKTLSNAARKWIVEPLGKKAGESFLNAKAPTNESLLKEKGKLGKIAGSLIDVGTNTFYTLRGVVAFPFIEDSFSYGLKNPHSSREAIFQVYERQLKFRGTFIRKLYTEMVGSSNDRALPWHTLLRKSKQMLDSTNEHIENVQAEFIRNSFDPEDRPNTAEMVQLTAGAVKTELFRLWTPDRNIEDVHKLLVDTEANIKETARARRQLYNDFPELFQYRRSINDQIVGLAVYMTKGDVTIPDLMLNPHNIINLSDSKIDITESMFERLAEVVTLQSLSLLPDSVRNTTAKRLDSEYRRNAVSNGIQAILHSHKQFITESNKELFFEEPGLQIMGYVKEKYNSNISIEITNADKEKEKDLKVRGYTKVARLDHAIGDYVPGNRRLYISTSDPTQRRVSGIGSTTSLHTKGFTIDDQYTDYVSNENTPVNPISITGYAKHARAVSRLEGKTKRDYAELRAEHATDGKFMLPVTDEKGNIKTYRYVMNERIKNTLLGKEDSVDTVIGSMYASINNKVNTQVFNRKIVDQAYEDFNKYFQDDSESFVKLSRGSKNPKYKELYQLMPEDMRNYAEEVFGERVLYLTEDYVDMILGFRKLSVITAISDKTNIGKFRLSAPITHAARQGAKLWTALVSRSKKSVVLYTPNVLIENEISNNIASIVQGIPINYTAKKKAEGLLALNRYIKQRSQRDTLAHQIKINDRLGSEEKLRIQKRVDKLTSLLDRNPVKPLIDEGLYQTIVEDVELNQDGFEKAVMEVMPEKYKDKIKTLSDITPSMMKSVYDYAVISPNTKLSAILTNATQASDFLGRYAMFKYMTEVQKKPADESIQKALDVFVSYEYATLPSIQWLNDVGLLRFTKFLFRIQKVILNQLVEKPANMLGLKLFDNVVNDIPDIADSFLPFKVTPSRMSNPLDITDEAFEINLAHYLPWNI